MTNEEKELLLKDICGRLPYGLVINIGDGDLKLDRKHQSIGILYPEDCSDEFNERNNNIAFYITISGCYYGEDIKPYLRPIESMTEEEKEEFRNVVNEECGCDGIHLIGNEGGYIIHYSWMNKCVDWLNKKMFDHRGLIPMGLALEAKEGMYNN